MWRNQRNQVRRDKEGDMDIRKGFSDDCCRPISMHEVWRDIGLRQIRVEEL